MDDSVTVDPISAKENQAMLRLGLSPRRTASGLAALLVGLAVPGLFEHEASAQAWRGYGLDAQHSCLSSTASQAPQMIRWSAPVDEAPPFNGSDLFIHYASPLITQKNTVIVTVRSQAGGFYLKALSGPTGLSVWNQNLTTDYILPPHNWIPTCGSTILPGDSKLAVPGAGGTVYIRTSPDRPTGTVTQLAFYGLANYQANPTGFNQTVFICTPITADSAGNLYFGFTVTANSPLAGLTAGSGGLAKISTTTGQGIWSSAAAITGDSNMQKVVNNGAPALSLDGSTVYVAVNSKNGGNSGYGYLVAVDSQTLGVQSKASVRLKDVRTPTADAGVADDGSGTPTVGPDGDVYYGVLEANLPSGNNDRGWMLHFSGDLSQSKIPGTFGWDDTASIVPAAALGSRYTGTSSYLILTKYNNYADFGFAPGNNMVAILDPNATESYLPHGATNPVLVMKEVITVLGVTPDTETGVGVREWCINSAAIDPINKCAVINSEDGHVYRWDFASNTLTASLALAQATGEAYTPTVIGPDGAVYAINRAVLNCCVANPSNLTLPTRLPTQPSPSNPTLLKPLQPFRIKPRL